MKYKAWLLAALIAAVWLVLYFSILIKLPFYCYMNQIKLPENCTRLESNVVITDLAYGWHITAECLIYSDHSEEEIENYINENNRFVKRITVINLFRSNNQDADHEILIPSGKYADSPVQDQEKYILLNYTSVKYEGNMFGIMVLLGLLVMGLLGRAVYLGSIQWIFRRYEDRHIIN